LEDNIIEVKWDRFSDQVNYTVSYRFWKHLKDSYYSTKNSEVCDWFKLDGSLSDEEEGKCTIRFMLGNLSKNIFRQYRTELEIALCAEREGSTVWAYETIALSYKLGIKKIDDLCSFLFVDFMLSKKFDDIKIYSKKFLLTGTARIF